jgi:hypothetical protein
MKRIVVKLLALIALPCSLATTARAQSFAKRVDIGGGRMMYIECHGSGSPTVLLISVKLITSISRATRPSSV